MNERSVPVSQTGWTGWEPHEFECQSSIRLNPVQSECGGTRSKSVSLKWTSSEIWSGRTLRRGLFKLNKRKHLCGCNERHMLLDSNDNITTDDKVNIQNMWTRRKLGPNVQILTTNWQSAPNKASKTSYVTVTRPAQWIYSMLLNVKKKKRASQIFFQSKAEHAISRTHIHKWNVQNGGVHTVSASLDSLFSVWFWKLQQTDFEIKFYPAAY